MTFAWPHLIFLIGVPVVLLVWEFRRRQRSPTLFHPKILQAEAGRNQLKLQGPGATRSRRARFWLHVGLIFSVVAVARPQWGKLEEPVFDQSREILIAIDLSRSMLAEDVKPSRLARAKLLISSLLEKLAGERVGLAVFSGTAFLQSPLSADYEILREFLPALNPDYLPEGGTNYRALVETTLQAFSTSASADRFLIVLSDGEATDENWRELVEQLQKKNIRAICLGIGTEAGAMIPDGAGAFVKDDRGAVVLSKLASSTLQDLAQKTKGVYRDASGWIDLAAVVRETVETGQKGEFVEEKTVRHIERFQWAMAPALLCFLLSFWREFPVRPKPRALKIAAAGLLLLGLALGGTPSLSAAEDNAQAEISPLGKIVARLSGLPAHTGQDWAELARETISWGQKLQTEQHPVPVGPVRDALAAVGLGSGLDRKTADWVQLRTELEALLQKPEPPPKDDKKNQDDPKDQDQKSDDQKDSPKDQKDSKDSSSDPSQSKDEQQKSEEQKSDQSDQQPQDQQSSPKDSAFGDMKEKAPPPPPPPGETQKVGGAPEKKDPTSADLDPALAMPLQKLQKIRDQDSPAELFQLMEGPPPPSAPKKGKTW